MDKVNFDDGSSIEIVGWAGGAHPDGMFSHITLMIQGPDKVVMAKGINQDTGEEYEFEDRSPGDVEFWDYDLVAKRQPQEPVTIDDLAEDAKQSRLAGSEGAPALYQGATENGWPDFNLEYDENEEAINGDLPGFSFDD